MWPTYKFADLVAARRKATYLKQKEKFSIFNIKKAINK